MNEKINEQLGLLEKELSRLKNVTDYVDDTKKNAQVIVSELKEVQKNYSTYTNKIYTLYQQAVDQLKRETELQIKEGVIQFETTGNKIDQTNREKLVETKRLLENYKKTVEATDNLVKTLEAVDFPSRLNKIEKKIDETQVFVNQRFDLQSRQNKVIKVLLYITISLCVVISGMLIKIIAF